MKHIERHHAITIPLAPEMTFALFTPLGEMRRFAEWQPEFIHPPDGAIQTGMLELELTRFFGHL